MGISSRFAFHARHRDGADRGHDHRKTQTFDQRRRQHRALAGLIPALLACADAAAADLRIAYLQTELTRDGPGLALRDILSGSDPQVLALIEVLRSADADVLVLGGIDHELGGVALGALADRIGGYPHRRALGSNRGRRSALDLDGDGIVGDLQSFGEFAGESGMGVLSRLPLMTGELRDVSAYPWLDLPGNLAPPGTAPEQELATTGFWDVPVRIPDGRRIDLLVWHATAPVFDGPEDRNGRRNHDEAAFWSYFLDGKIDGPPPVWFVLAGTPNLDPADGEGRPRALQALLADPRLQDPLPASAGAVTAAARDGGVNEAQAGDPALDTADFPDARPYPGNLRLDYVLPATSLTVTGAGVLWPAPDDLLGEEVRGASRHRLVWVDLALPQPSP